MSDGPRSHRIPLNGGAIKVITLQTIKKGHESPGQLWLLPHFQFWAVFSLPPLCPGRSIWLGTRFRSCRRHSSRGSGCHRTWFARRRRLATTSHNGTRHRLLRRKEGGKSGSFSSIKQRYSRCMWPRSGTHWLSGRRRHMTQTHLLCKWLHVSEWKFRLRVYGALTISCLSLHTCFQTCAWALERLLLLYHSSSSTVARLCSPCARKAARGKI